MKLTYFKIKGLKSNDCERKIQNRLEDEDGIIEASSSRNIDTLVVYYDDHKIREKQIEKIITNEGLEIK